MKIHSQTKVIVTTDALRLKSANSGKGRACYVSFKKRLSQEETTYLEQIGFEKIDLGAFLLENRAHLAQKVSEYSASLNQAMNEPFWWAHNISRRAAMYQLASSLAKFFIVSKLLTSKQWEICMVIDDSTKPWIYLEKMKHTEITLRVECSESERRRDWVKEVVPFEIIRWFLSKIKLKNRIGWKQRIPILDKEIPVIVQFTLVDKKCFERNGYFHDIYFGPLREYLQRANKTVFILVDFIAQLTDEFLGLVRRAANPKITFLDELWRPLDLLSVTLKAVGEFYKADKNWAPSKFEGFDLRCFLTAYWKWDIVPQYLNALLYYRSAKHLFKHIHVEHLIYPFENRCIERMLLKAIRETHPEAMTIGYQHAVLTPKHLHMFFVPGEAEITPLPDRIVTNGRWTAKLLIEEGHYPPNKIVEGVTLRFIHKQTNGLTRYSPKKSISKILVALAGGVDEYDKTFEFLDKISSLKSRQMEFRIRLHPNCPYDPFLSPKHKDKVYLKKDPVSSLYDSLEWAQVVMYTSTSVSILAMTEGIPVVWMDIMDFWGTDPIYRDDLLRWRITYPDYWENVINEIEGLTEEEFKKRWEASCKFCEEYFCFDDSKVGSLFLD